MWMKRSSMVISKQISSTTICQICVLRELPEIEGIWHLTWKGRFVRESSMTFNEGWRRGLTLIQANLIEILHLSQIMVNGNMPNSMFLCTTPISISEDSIIVSGNWESNRSGEQRHHSVLILVGSWSYCYFPSGKVTNSHENPPFSNHTSKDGGFSVAILVYQKGYIPCGKQLTRWSYYLLYQKCRYEPPRISHIWQIIPIKIHCPLLLGGRTSKINSTTQLKNLKSQQK